MIHHDPVAAGIVIGVLFSAVLFGLCKALQFYIEDKLDALMIEHWKAGHLKK